METGVHGMASSMGFDSQMKDDCLSYEEALASLDLLERIRL